MDAIPPLEMTLDELAEALAPLLGGHAAFDGWTPKALEMAASELGVPAERAVLGEVLDDPPPVLHAQ